MHNINHCFRTYLEYFGLEEPTYKENYNDFLLAHECEFWRNKIHDLFSFNNFKKVIEEFECEDDMVAFISSKARNQTIVELDKSPKTLFDEIIPNSFLNKRFHEVYTSKLFYESVELLIFMLKEAKNNEDFKLNRSYIEYLKKTLENHPELKNSTEMLIKRLELKEPSRFL